MVDKTILLSFSWGYKPTDMSSGRLGVGPVMFPRASTLHSSGVVYFPLTASLTPKNTEATEVVTECQGSNS